MPRPKGNAAALEDRRRRAVALVDSGCTLNEAARRIGCVQFSGVQVPCPAARRRESLARALLFRAPAKVDAPARAAFDSVVGAGSFAARLRHQCVNQQADRAADRGGVRHLLSLQSHRTTDVPARLESSKAQETSGGARSRGHRRLEAQAVAAHKKKQRSSAPM